MMQLFALQKCFAIIITQLIPDVHWRLQVFFAPTALSASHQSSSSIWKMPYLLTSFNAWVLPPGSIGFVLYKVILARQITVCMHENATIIISGYKNKVLELYYFILTVREIILRKKGGRIGEENWSYQFAPIVDLGITWSYGEIANE